MLDIRDRNHRVADYALYGPQSCYYLSRLYRLEISYFASKMCARLRYQTQITSLHFSKGVFDRQAFCSLFIGCRDISDKHHAVYRDVCLPIAVAARSRLITYNELLLSVFFLTRHADNGRIKIQDGSRNKTYSHPNRNNNN